MDRLRQVVAKKVGDETVLQNLINTDITITYVKNDHQYAKIHEHVWNDTQKYLMTQELSGKSSEKGEKGEHELDNLTLDLLADLFSNVMGEVNERFEILNIGDARSLRTHQDGLLWDKGRIHVILAVTTMATETRTETLYRLR